MLGAAQVHPAGEARVRAARLLDELLQALVGLSCDKWSRGHGLRLPNALRSRPADDDSADLLPTVRPSKESDTRLAISNASGIPTVTVLTPRAPGRMPPCAPTAPGPPQLRRGALTGSGDIAAPGHTSSRRAVTSLTDGS
ncbi:hypothetical protein GCM10018781_45410 [Kitasatospora indigofera]|uniref:Uncharacterized protein n=1 Tax=Kitasatospora indigofera TaxID=67307 RepID=A0A919KXH5_9ACTN|nr:hypothetical protein GCM10018781_45410 [Kitasatospora indigofera]